MFNTGQKILKKTYFRVSRNTYQITKGDIPYVLQKLNKRKGKRDRRWIGKTGERRRKEKKIERGWRWRISTRRESGSCKKR